MPLDVAQIVGRKTVGPNTVGQCPACAADGRDRSQNHLIAYEDGRFGCAFDRSEEHYKAIYALIGVKGSGEAKELTASLEEPQIEIPKIWPADCLARLVKEHSYWAGRGISDETVTPFRGGVATNAIFKDRYVFPQFNADGEIIGFSGRCLRQMTDAERKQFKRPKWKHLEPSSQFIWGGLEEIEETGEANLVESIGDSLALREHGVPANLCLFGTNLSDALLGYLISVGPRRIRVSTNRDVARVINGRTTQPGQDAAIRIARRLNAFFDEGVVAIVHPPEGVNDWGVASAEQIAATFAEETVSAAEAGNRG